MRENETDEPIAIVGMECAFPGAANLREYWSNLASGRDAITEMPPHRMNDSIHFRLPNDHPARVHCQRGGFLPESVRFEPIRHGVMPNIVEHGDPDQFLMLQIADAAVQDAGLRHDGDWGERTDVIVGRGGYHTNKMAEIYLRVDLIEHLIDFLGKRFPQLSSAELRDLAESMRAELPPTNADSLSTCMPNLVASRVANRLNLRGLAVVIDAACASSLLAVDLGMQRLRTGRCDAVVAGAIHLVQLPAFWFVFEQLGALSPTSTIRPFDRRADGLVIGEGAGAVVLMRLSDAMRNGHRIYAVLRGMGVSSDGRDTGILSPNYTGQVLALRRAYKNAQLSPDSIGLLEAHGTATAAGDANELRTIREFFPAGPPIHGLGSVKSMIGHTMPAAGMASLIKSALALHNRVLPPSLHCENPVDELQKLPFFLCDQPRAWFRGPNAPPRRAGINAFGFGGINVHAVLEEAPQSVATVESPHRLALSDASSSETAEATASPTVDRAGSWPTELLVLGSVDFDGLRAAATHLLELLQSQRRLRVADLSYHCWRQFNAKSPMRVCLLVEDQQQAQERLQELVSALEQQSFPVGKHIFASKTPIDGPPKVAGVFPGVGFPGLLGNYPDHLLSLCQHFPEARREFDKIELRDELDDDPIPTSLIFAPPQSWDEDLRVRLKNRLAVLKVQPDSEEERDVPADERNLAASCVTLSNWISWVLLRELRIPVDMLCGQSQGEMAAMAAAGMLDIDQVIPRFWQSLALSASYTGNGRMAFVASSEKDIVPLIDDLPGVAIAIHVSPEMLVLGGPTEELQRFSEVARAKGKMVQLMPYPPIHTPQMSHMREALRRVIDLDMPIHSPKVTCYSAITERPFPEDEESVRDLALGNLDRPVRFWQTIHRMYDDGARIFIQIGGGSLAANIATILPSDKIMLTAVDLDHCDPLTQLQTMCARLIVAGVPVDLDLLFRHRFISDIQTKPKPVHSVPYRFDWIPFASNSETSDGPPVEGNGDANPLEPPSPKKQERVDEDRADVEANVGADVGLSHTADETAQRIGGVNPAPGCVFARSIEERVENERVVFACRIDLDEDLFLADHVFLAQAESKELQDCLPVVPMMFGVEIVAEAAKLVVPNGQVLRVENVQAKRWIASLGNRHLDLKVTGRIRDIEDSGARRVDCEIFCDSNLCLTATVTVGTATEETLGFLGADGEEKWPLTAAEMYEERHLFHGPRFQCVVSLETIGPEGATAVIQIPDYSTWFRSAVDSPVQLEPVVLDGLAQLFGIWIIVNGYYALPTGVEAIEIYESTPPVGTVVDVRLRVTKYDPEKRTASADVEVIDSEGWVWLRVRGLQQWLFHYSPELLDAQRLPNDFTLSTEEAFPLASEECVLVTLNRSKLLHANIEWLARMFLATEEMREFESVGLLAKQRDWLMERIVAKDATRLWLARHDNGPMLHPADIVIGNRENGAPYVRSALQYETFPEISVAGSNGTFVAVADPQDCAVGVDLTFPANDVLEQYATSEERRLGSEAKVDCWNSRLLGAKEAIAKYLQTDNTGRLLDFQVVEVTTTGTCRIHHLPTGTVLPVMTWTDSEKVCAFTGQAYIDSWFQNETETR